VKTERRNWWNRSLLGLGLAVLTSAFCFSQSQTGPADMILVNGRAFTATDARPFAEAVAIKGDKILAVDTTEKISELAGSATKRIDLHGRVVIPGMMDTHIHYYGVPVPGRLDIDFGEPMPSCAKVLQMVEEKVRTMPPGKVLTGNMGIEAFFDPRCTPAELDRIAPAHAVVLTGPTPHVGMLNRAAVTKFKVDTSALPPLAGWYGKDMNSKRWDGVVHNSAFLALATKLITDGTEDDERLHKFFLQEAKYGVTSNTFLEYDPGPRIAQLARVNAPNRVRIVPFAQYQTGPTRRALEHPAVPQHLAERVTVAGQKWLLDGTPIERSAALRLPYADDPKTSGRVDYPEGEIGTILREALRQDQPLMMHAVGDRTAEVLFTEMDNAGGEKVWAKRRVRVEHGDGVVNDLIPRAKRLGVIVAVNPMHFDADTGNLLRQRFGSERAEVMLPCRSLLDGGVPVVIASDGGFGEPDLNPFLNIQMATTYPSRPRDAISREQALIAYTRTPAYSEFTDDRLGTLEPGKLADLAVLSRDIFKVPSEELPTIESELTIIGGKIVYSRNPAELAGGRTSSFAVDNK